MTEAWEPSKKRTLSEIGEHWIGKHFSLFFFYFECWSLYGNIRHQYNRKRGLDCELTAEDKLVIYISTTAKNKVCNIPH